MAGEHWPGPERPDERDLDRLFDVARSAVHRPPDLDVDRVLTVAAARADGRWSLRLAALRAGGIALVLGVLVAWIVLFGPSGPDVLYAVVLFAIPTIAVFRWHLQATDGRGIIPWRTPRTVDAWSNEAIRRVAELDRSIAALDRLAGRLDRIVAGSPPGWDALVVRAGAVRSDAGSLAAMLDSCSRGSTEFIDTCRTTPAQVDWKLVRDTDPDRAREMLGRIVAGLAAMAAAVPELPGGDAAPALLHAVTGCNRETLAMREQVVGRCGKVLRALDRLHGLAVTRSVQPAPGLPGVGSIAVGVSGWWRPAVQKPGIRAVLLDAEPAGVGAWARAVTHARSVVRADALAFAGGGVR